MSRPRVWVETIAKTALARVSALLLVSLLGLSPGAARADDEPVQRPAAEKLDVYGQLPEFALIDSAGRPFTRKDLAGAVWIFDFIFTSCSGPCPVMTAKMAELRKGLAASPRVRFASITVDPARDTPAVLAAYAAAAGAVAPEWIFLTGEKKAIFSLSRDGFKLGVEENDPKALDTSTMPLLHSSRFVLADGRGRIRGYFDGTDDEAVNRLSVEARALLSAGEKP